MREKTGMKRIILFVILLTLMRIDVNGQDELKSRDEGLICCFDSQPTFPGGTDSLRSFIYRNLKYPRGVFEYEGRVFVEFIVNEDGSLTDLVVIRGLCDLCDRNAIEVLSKMPKWIPAKRKDRPVRSKFSLPISYRLSN